ncbi:flagellar hook-length control protein FliK [Crenobacter cavernae]|uniref:Flagellar hook-length control protein FliK n=1 Tax=Crenobacter cavernae TaxID=2290923 RepID=A0ABY0FEU4_9NEIS|nr:flagellar hook-length control protein FliK [Crenobacter cavernae]RXZ44824.1 flagellar hook-length control protein FliK [Crenobacter cavernae]
MINPLVPPPGASVTPSLPSGTPAAQGVSAVRLLREGSRPLIEASVLPARLPSLVVGEEVDARVAERLDGNRLVALIKGNAFTLDLPQNLTVRGDSLHLKVTRLDPTPTFVLLDSHVEAEAAADSSSNVQLSRSAQYLNGLLDAARGRGATGTRESAPALLSSRPDQPETLADGLKQAIGKSGAFYESHLKAWSEGRLPLDALKDEPQARLETGRMQDGAHAARQGASSPELGQLVQRQLDTLENRQLQMPVLAWPGQPAQVTIQEEQVADRDAHHDDASARAWHTRLDLDLPSLGGLLVKLTLSGGAVQVRFAADDADSAALIERHGARLTSGMASAGLDLAQLTVASDARLET